MNYEEAIAALGKDGRDKITGFTGVIWGVTKWMNGCMRIGLQSKKLKDDGSVLEPQWFDQQQVEIIDERTIDQAKTSSGGPMPDPFFGGRENRV